MLNTWSKELPSGVSVVYSYCETEEGVFATALIKGTRQVYSEVLDESVTRSEVERVFESHLAGHIRSTDGGLSAE